MRKYNVEETEKNTIIWYEENNKRISFMADPANQDYEAYLQHLTENPTEGDE